MTTRSFSLFLLLAAGVAGCASPSGGAPATQQSRPRAGSRNVITAEEITTIDVQNALQAVQRLRPNFLQTRGNVSITQGKQEIVVYIDQTRMGGPSALAQIPITEVREIQYLSGTDATQRFGTGHGSGAIIVLRK